MPTINEHLDRILGDFEEALNAAGVLDDPQDSSRYYQAVEDAYSEAREAIKEIYNGQ